MTHMITIAMAGALGVLCRYLVQKHIGGELAAPELATMGINVVGSFIIGVVFAAGDRLLSQATAVVLATGFLGGFTTFSAYSLETIKLFQNGGPLMAWFYTVASPALGILAALCGVTIARRLGV